jgi:hypothetical protein
MRLGEVLLQKDIISKRQLKEGLDAQLIYGGHLGTCLIELGFVSEQQLGEVLSEMLNVRLAPPEMFEDLSTATVAALPSRLVEKHHAIPLRQEGRHLDVAMLNPNDLQALDELSFASGAKIRSWVAPEVRLYQAMERYYEIPRRARYVALSRRLDQTARYRAGMQPRHAASRGSGGTATATQAGVGVELTTGNLDSTALQLCAAESAADLPRVVLGYASARLERCILFRVGGATAMVWDAAGFDDGQPDREVELPIITEPLFGLLRGSDAYRGKLPEGKSSRGFFDRLQIEAPGEILLLPVHVDDRLVAMFYGDSGATGTMEGNTEAYKRLLRKFALSLDLVALKSKILSV